MKRKKDRFDALDEIDFFIDSLNLTEEDEKRISEIIARHKAKSKTRRKKVQASGSSSRRKKAA